MSFLFNRLEKEITNEKKPIPDLHGVPFGSIFTDHMLIATYDHEWKSIKIVPFSNISLPPQASIFHYGTGIFEGLKAFRDLQGKVRLFRPDMNCVRFANSAKRMALPAPDPDELMKCIIELVRVDERWVPYEEGYSLYIRPTMIGTTPSLGLKKCDQCLLYIILSPVGHYYTTGFKPISLWACNEYCRAWPGGTGNFKVAPNYGITVMPGEIAHEKNCQQVLWLYGKEEYITEVGSMNIMGVWINENGEKELVTAPVSKHLILPGVTRDSVLELARMEKDIKVSEEEWKIGDLIKALNEKRVLEVFGTGTAAIISPVNKIIYNDKCYDIPVDLDNPNATIGPFAHMIYDKLRNIQYGVVNHKWSVLI
ncbi:branched-chain-amino-acid aminotransferase, cytosolic isoform X1 [Histomonas meleagridis]|uniref:branched-chain-amino-acid aminotransferase, cytosolic isoform X1 n=1 Tax=Histomonas meleagridis TaxID=135588 RepID=UPI00355A8A6F|nr:branched-chain-amino-acid aminotransferase, cytosolic isoform X1 [Histomonas meleagridis]KAH0798391.1 branched-chain-amino-acid aminotransferase, cytosolic isoform X1 [Histomonas meleagridis]